jgi:hypothetical protein
MGFFELLVICKVRRMVLINTGGWWSEIKAG